MNNAVANIRRANQPDLTSIDPKHHMESVSQRVISGLFSTGASKAALVIINLLLTAVLARLLGPKEFGLVGMVAVFTTLLGMMGSLGLDGAIVQRKDITHLQLSTLFWIKLGVGVVSAVLLFVGSYPISRFYGEPRLIPITQVLSLVFVSSALYQSHRSLQRRDLNFSRINRITITSVIGSGGIGIGAAAVGLGVWSLVAQAIALDVLSGLQYWRASTWRPTFEFSLKDAMPLLRFGFSMAGGVFTQSLQRNLDMLLIGRLLGTVSLGHYSLAYRLMFAPVRNISIVVTDVLFPALSRVQDRADLLRMAFRRALRWVSLLTFPSMAFVAVHGEGIVVTAFGEQWRLAGNLLVLLAPAGAVQSLTQVAYVIFPVVGRPGLAAKLGVFNCALLALAIWIGTRWDAVGACWGMLFATSIIWLVSEVFALRLLGLTWWTECVALRTGLVGVVLVALIKLGFHQAHAFPDQSVPSILLQGTLACMAWIALVAFLERDEVTYFVSKVRRMLPLRLLAVVPPVN